MKQLQKQLGYSIAAVAIVLGLAVAPVSAEHGGISDTSTTSSTSSGSGDSSQADSSGSSDSSSTSTNETENRVALAEDNTSGDDSGQSGKLRSEAQKMLEQERQNGKEHSAAERQQACDKRQANINRRTARFAAQAAKHLSTFNSIFTKLQTFHDSKGLNVAKYDMLVADATAKQTAAQSAVDALKTLDVNINCTQSDPATTVATIKTAVGNARTALQDYRTSLKNLVVALKGASTAQTGTQSTDNTQGTGGTQ